MSNIEGGGSDKDTDLNRQKEMDNALSELSYKMDSDLSEEEIDRAIDEAAERVLKNKKGYINTDNSPESD